jgi:hypothetical protein
VKGAKGLAEDGRVGTAFSPYQWIGDEETVDETNSSGAMCRGQYCLRQNLLRIVLTVLTGTLAVVFGAVFSQILSIVGALGFSLLSFILPPLLYLKIFKNELTCPDRALSIFIFVIGLVGMSISTYIDGASIIAYFEGNSTDPCRNN